MLAFVHTPGCPPGSRLFIISGRIHVSQKQSVPIDRSPIAWVDMIHAKLLNHVGNFSHAPREGSGNLRSAFAAINCGQRLDSALGPRNDSFSARTQRTRKQPVNPFCREVWHVAGENQVPWRMRRAQSGGDPRERSISCAIRPTLSLHIIRDHVQSEVRVSTGRSDNRDLGDERLDQPRGMQDQRNAAKIEQSLVAAHARADASGKNKSRDLAIAFHDGPAILRLRAELSQRSGEL